jgi:Tfp pilus assembly protein PilN
MNKHSINLLTDDLLPKTDLLTLGRVVGLWVGALILGALLTITTGNGLSKTQSEYTQLMEEKDASDVLLKNLEQQISSNRADSVLLDELEQLKILVNMKSTVAKKLSDEVTGDALGYSSTMTALADLHHRDISLSRVAIVDNEVTFVGYAKDADSVPQWLSGLEKSDLLKGMKFSQFSLSESENRLTQFIVSSSGKKVERGDNSE